MANFSLNLSKHKHTQLEVWLILVSIFKKKHTHMCIYANTNMLENIKLYGYNLNKITSCNNLI